MNGRQAAKKAAKRIAELEDYNRKSKADIKAYNRVITGIIAGEDPCEWCEEKPECDKEKGKGCENWWLAFTHPFVKEEDADDSESVPVVGSEGGT